MIFYMNEASEFFNVRVKFELDGHIVDKHVCYIHRDTIDNVYFTEFLRKFNINTI